MASLGVVDGANWSKNSVISATGAEVVFTAGANNDFGDIVYTAGTFGRQGYMTLEAFLATTTQGLEVGMLDSAASTTNAATHVGGQATFYGCLCQTNSNQVFAVQAGVQSTDAFAVSLADATYHTFYFGFVISGTSWVIKVFRDTLTNLVAYVATTSGTTPSYSTMHPAIGGWNGGAFGGTYKARNIPAWDDVTSAAPIQNLAAIPFSTSAQISWYTHPLATSYDYRVNGGTPVNVAETNPSGTPIQKTVITGLTISTSYTVEVRPVNSDGAGSWTSVVMTTVATIIADTFDRTAVAPSTTALGTSTDGHAWTQPTGSLGIDANGYAYCTANAENLAIFSAARDVDITAYDVRGANGNSAIIFRYRDVNNYLMLNLSGSPDFPAIHRKVAGGFTGLVTLGANLGSWTPGDNLRVVAYGAMFWLYRNSYLLGAFEDPTSLVTDVGVGFRMATANQERFGAYVVTPSTIPAALATAGTGGLRDIRADGLVPAPPSAGPGWLYKGRDTQALDTVGAS